jgi:hypothetical protein
MKNYLNFLKENNDTLEGLSYYDLLIKSSELLGLNIDLIKNTINSNKYIGMQNNSFSDNAISVLNGEYMINNIIAYHNIREKWRKVALAGGVNADCAKNLLSRGYHIEKIDSDTNYFLDMKLNFYLFMKYIYKREVFYNKETQKFKKILSRVKDLSSELYDFNEEIKGNIQYSVSPIDPLKSWATDLYEYHFDLPYPNIKYFYTIIDHNEMHGTYAYLPKSNILSIQNMSYCIASALYSSSSGQVSKYINCVSEYYGKSGIYEHIENKGHIYLMESIKFDLPKNHLVVTDNFGLHRKTFGKNSYSKMRLYYHPIPYPRSNKKHFELM